MDRNVIDHVFLGKWRMNRRQYLNVAILLYIIPIWLSWILGIVLAIYFPGAITSKEAFYQSPIMMPILVISSIFPLFLTWACVRRSHDIGIKPFWLPWILTIVFLISRLYTIDAYHTSFLADSILSVLFAFYPWKKDKNIYWEQPKDLKKVSEIFRFWWTGKS